MTQTSKQITLILLTMIALSTKEAVCPEMATQTIPTTITYAYRHLIKRCTINQRQQLRRTT